MFTPGDIPKNRGLTPDVTFPVTPCKVVREIASVNTSFGNEEAVSHPGLTPHAPLTFAGSSRIRPAVTAMGPRFRPLPRRP